MAKQFELKALIMGVDKLSPKLREIQGNLKAWRGKVDNLARGALPMAAGLGAGIGITAKAFADAENAATGLKVAMMGAGGKVAPEFEKITEMATRLGDKLPGTTADFQNMMAELVKQGISARSILGGTGEAAAYLAVQLGKSPKDAAEFAAKLQDATKTTEGDMLGLMDVIQKTSNLGVDDGNMLQGFAKLSSVMDMTRQKGLAGAKALAPLLTMFDQSGLVGESAGNAFRKVVEAGFDKTKINKVNKLLGKRNVKLDFTNGKGEWGGMENMFAQFAKLRGLTTLGRKKVMTELFGEDAETQQALSILMEKGLSGYKEIIGKMDAQASLNERVNAQLGTLSNVWEAATGTFTNALAAIGQAYAPELKSLANAFGDLSGKISDFAKAHPDVIRGAVAAAGALTAFKLAAYGVSVGIRLASMAMAATPIGLIATGIALAAGLIIANWDKVGPFFTRLWSWIKAGAAFAWDIIQKFAGFSPIGMILQNWQPILEFFKNLWGQIKGYLQPVMDAANWVGEKIQGFGALSPAEQLKLYPPPNAQPSGAPTPGASSLFPRLAPQKPGMQPDANPAPMNGWPAAAGISPLLGNRNNVSGAVTVRFENTPPGTRVDTQQSSGSPLQINPDVGYRSAIWGGS